MTRARNKKNQQGVALIVALFALLLLSAIGLAMMYSSSTETSINSNFRDKQSAAYASMSGALEARDRIQPATGDITAPTAIPSSSSANVIYIINPYGSETVAPWSSSNKYADSELCEETISGFCSSGSLPSGSSWYTTKDDSSSGSFGTGFSAYNQSTPLPYKWARITLKTDNMTPAPAAGSPGTGNPVCWDGAHQVVLSSATGSCSPTGAVTGITVTNAGSNYNHAPTVTIGAPPSGGTQATATATITTVSSGQIVSGSVSNGGSGYTSPPTITLVGGDGTGAVAQATIKPPGSPVASVTGLSTPDANTACYTTAPGVSFNGSGGETAASGSTTLASTTSCVYAVSTSKNSGSCSYPDGTVTFGVSNGGGSGFQGALTFKSNKISAWTVNTPGTGFTGTPSTITGLTGCSTNPTVTFTMGYHVNAVNVTNGGAGYTAAPAVVITAPTTNSGTVQTATANLGAPAAGTGVVTGITISSPGSGYTIAPTVTFGTDGGGTGAVGSVAIGNVSSKGAIASISITNGGSGYTTAPAVTFSNSGSGSGAAATSTISSGAYLGQVYLITSYAQTPSGSKAMTQMEVAQAVRSFALAGALTLDGPSPSYASPNSNPFQVLGADANGCGETAASTKPAIGVYDDPNHPTAQSAVTTVINSLGVPANYIGAKPAPDVENVYGALGQEMTSVAGMEGLANAIAGMSGANTYTGSVSSVNLGTSSTPVVDVVNGDVTFSGKTQGYGILLVRGTLRTNGNFSWNGPIFVIGQGVFNSNGGGNGQITGMVWVAKTKDASGNLLANLGSPTLGWNGGGGNGIQYDHCWADNLVNTIHYTPPQPTTPLKILSTRTVTF